MMQLLLDEPRPRLVPNGGLAVYTCLACPELWGVGHHEMGAELVHVLNLGGNNQQPWNIQYCQYHSTIHLTYLV